MKLFKFIRESLKNIGFKATYVPKHDSLGVATPDTIKVDEHKAIRESVRKQFAEQDMAMRIRASKAHSSSCVDNWTCKAEPCFVLEPDVIVKHKAKCIHANGVIMTEPMCKCGKSTQRLKDKDFVERD